MIRFLCVWLTACGLALAAPANDHFASSQTLTGLPATASGSNIGATMEPGEPLPYDDSESASVWFDWTPATAGPVRIDTVGSGFDTVLAVWTGTSLGNLVKLAADDDFSGSQSAVFLNVSPGIHYRIAIYGYDSGDTGAVVLNIKASSAIAGTVTGPDGTTPLGNIQVTTYQWDSGDEEWYSVQSSNTSNDGSYAVSVPDAGTYRLGFSDDEGGYLSEYYNNADSVVKSADIPVAAESVVSGINASLALASHISGTVTGPGGIESLEGIHVQIIQWNASWEDWDYLNSTHTHADGTYDIGGLTAGTYRVEFHDENEGIYLNQYFDGVTDLESASDLVVPAATTVGGIDASLSDGAKIRGMVTGPGGLSPLQGIQMTAYRWDGYWESVRSFRSLADGSYLIRGLNAGIYRIGYYDPNGGYQSGYYEGAAGMEDATNIFVPTETTVDNIDVSLSLAARISGTVTGPDGVAPLEYIEIDVYRWNPVTAEWEYTDDVYTDENGSYHAGDLLPGTYRVAFVDSDSGLYATEYYNDSHTLEAATDIVVAAEAHVDDIDASLAERASIAGIVTGPDGITPLKDIRVAAYRWDADDEDWYSYRSGNTSADGSYTVRGLEEGGYRLAFTDYSGNYKSEYYDNAGDLDSGVDIHVGAGSIVSGIDASLGPASRISGTVTAADGTGALEEIYVRVYQWDAVSEYWEQVSGSYTDDDGTYSVGGLDAGTYRVGFFDYNWEIYVDQYYNGAGTLAAATDVIVASSTTVGGIDAALSDGARISGNVTDSDGVTPLKNIRVTAYRWDDAEEYWDSFRSGTTLANGHYVVRGLAAGAYRLQFSSIDGKYLDEYFDDAANVWDATDIVVAADEQMGGIDASLASASAIAGTVTGPDGTLPLEGIGVEVYRWDAGSEDWDYVTDSETDEDGTYRIGGLTAGSYRIGFYSGTYLGEYYNNAATLNSATDIVVAASTEVSDIDASLGLGASIRGKVTGPDGVTPLRYIRVTAYRWNEGESEWEYASGRSTDSAGIYRIGGLVGGVYRLNFSDDNDEIYKSEYYNDAGTLEDATDIVVAAEADVSGINASLGEGSRISGVITGTGGTSPLKDITVTAYVFQENWGYWETVRSANTLADGSYNLRGLDAGVYRIGFRDWSGSHNPGYYQGSADIENAVDIDVAANSVTAGIDGSLSRASRILGTVTGPNGLTPLGDIDVTLYQWDPDVSAWRPVRSTPTDYRGNYKIGGLVAGTYRVGFADPGYFNLASEWYEDSVTLSGATDIVVADQSDVTGIDASLSEGGRISGRVTGPGGAPVEGVEVLAYVWNETNGNWQQIKTASTRPDGNYTIRGLNTDMYRLNFVDENYELKSEFYDNAYTIEDATPVSVVAGTQVAGIDASLTIFSAISGTVTGPDGMTPLEGISIQVYTWNAAGEFWMYLTGRSTDEDGRYLVNQLDAGVYRVGFADAWEAIYQTEFYNDSGTLDAATDIVVAVESEVSGIDASMGDGAHIAGVVTGPDGTSPLAGINVSVYRWADDYHYWQYIRSEQTLADGSYLLRGLYAGLFRVGFVDDSGTYMTAYYGGSTDFGGATNIEVAVDAVVSDINVSLARHSRILGTVTGPDGITPVEDVEVVLYRWDPGYPGWEPIVSVFTNQIGEYVMGAVDPGTYRVGYFDRGNHDLAREWYDDSVTLDGSTDIEIPAGTDIAGINASLAVGGKISGHVTGTGGMPLESIQVIAYTWSADNGGWHPGLSTHTLEDGSYVFVGLSNDSYRLEFQSNTSDFISEFHADAASLETATPVAVSAGDDVTGIDASLARYSGISGRVTGADGVTSLESIMVHAYLWNDVGSNWEFINYTYTDQAGMYRLGTLSPGRYRLFFQDMNEWIYLSEYYDNAQTLESAKDILVAAESEVLGIDASLITPDLVPAGIHAFRKVGPGLYELDFSGAPGGVFQLQQSSDLRNWTDVGDAFECQPGTNILPTASSEPSMFWRVRSDP